MQNGRKWDIIEYEIVVFCTVNDADADGIKDTLKEAGYIYDPELNQFR